MCDCILKNHTIYVVIIEGQENADTFKNTLSLQLSFR